MKKYSTLLYSIMYSFKGWQNNKNHVFPSKRCASNEKTCYCYTFYNENYNTYLYVICNKQILFAKKYLSLLWLFIDFPFLLFCFLNINTAITLQLTRTARTLEAEWWQVWGEAWVRGQRKMNQVLGAFGLLDFTMLLPVLPWRAFLNLWTIYFFNVPFFWGAAANRG